MTVDVNGCSVYVYRNNIISISKAFHFTWRSFVASSFFIVALIIVVVVLLFPPFFLNRLPVTPF